jgi:hypothetical protein
LKSELSNLGGLIGKFGATSAAGIGVTATVCTRIIFFRDRNRRSKWIAFGLTFGMAVF